MSVIQISTKLLCKRESLYIEALCIKGWIFWYRSSCNISIEGRLFNFHFSWEFGLVQSKPDLFYQQITLPNLASISHLLNAQKKLVELLKGEITIYFVPSMSESIKIVRELIKYELTKDFAYMHANPSTF